MTCCFQVKPRYCHEIRGVGLVPDLFDKAGENSYAHRQNITVITENKSCQFRRLRNKCLEIKARDGTVSARNRFPHAKEALGRVCKGCPMLQQQNPYSKCWFPNTEVKSGGDSSSPPLLPTLGAGTKE